MTSAADRSLAEMPSLAHLAPPVVRPDDPIDVVVRALSRDPGADMAFVIDERERLLGVVPERVLDADLMTLVLPPDMVSGVVMVGGRDALRAARGRNLTAAEIMAPIGSATPRTTIRDAIAAMWRGERRVLPLVDEAGTLLGYVALFELLAALLPDTSRRLG